MSHDAYHSNDANQKSYFLPILITTLVSIKVVNETIVVTNETKPIGKNSL